jgi:DNA topoisomerase-1
MKPLIIIESPGKIKKLRQILGPEYEIAASVGHIRDLPLKSMGVSAPEFKPEYELTERGKEVVTKLKAQVKQATEVYLATDPDREGESIAWHLKQSLNLKDPKRVTFNEITEQAVKTAMQKTGDLNYQLVGAQEARRVLDRLVGYMVSPELRNQTGQALSAGRVQSPAVRLVVERERAIQVFKPTNHFGVQLYFDGMNGQWFADWKTQAGFTNEENPYVLDRSLAEAVAKTKQVKVVSFKDSESKRSPPPPFTTSTLQQAASVSLNMNPDQTMQVAQKLYEQGHITYHRTDNPNLSAESLDSIRQEMQTQLNLKVVDTMRTFPAPEGAQVGHPAITPTHWELEVAGETQEQQDLYRLIRLRAIACQLEDARYAVRTALLVSIDKVDDKAVHFEAKGRTLLEQGWLALTAEDATEENRKEEIPNHIPKLSPEQILAVDGSKVMDKKTKAPPRYTQASLVKKLESEGIGRPATYAAIMSNITQRGYVKLEKKQLLSTSLGETIVDSLLGTFDFMDLEFTRNVEKDLDLVAQGKKKYLDVVTHVHEQLQRDLTNLNAKNSQPSHPCPKCSKPLRQRKGKNGLFWGCSGYPDCDVTMVDKAGQAVVREKNPISEYTCKECGKPLIHRTKSGPKGYDFWGCSGFKDGCKTSYKNDSDKPLFGHEGK